MDMEKINRRHRFHLLLKRPCRRGVLDEASLMLLSLGINVENEVDGGRSK